MNIHQRQTDIIDPELLDFPITVIGVGGIGSWVTLALAKMGCQNISIYDPDIVELHNTATQFYEASQDDDFKVDALAENIHAYSGVDLYKFGHKYQRTPNLSGYEKGGVIICAVDSFTERQNIWGMLQNTFMREPGNLYIDARMAGELLRVFMAQSGDIHSMETYSKGLDKKPDEIDHEPCTARAVVYTTFLSGGIIANIVKRYAKKEEIPTDVIMDMSNLSFYKGGEF